MLPFFQRQVQSGWKVKLVTCHTGVYVDEKRITGEFLLGNMRAAMGWNFVMGSFMIGVCAGAWSAWRTTGQA